MLNILSVLIGVVALLFVLPGVVPLLGWLNWPAVVIGIVGLALGAMSSRNAGRNLNVVVLVVAAARLLIGGGIL